MHQENNKKRYENADEQRKDFGHVLDLLWKTFGLILSSKGCSNCLAWWPGRPRASWNLPENTGNRSGSGKKHPWGPPQAPKRVLWDPNCSPKAPRRTPKHPKGRPNASFWDHFKIIWDHVGIISESFWDTFGISLGSSGDHFGIMLESSWDHFGIRLGSFSNQCRGYFGISLGSFWNHFGIILETC